MTGLKLHSLGACWREVSGPRIERQSQTERLLPSSALGASQRFGDTGRARFLAGQGLQCPHMFCRPGAACRCFLNHQTTPGVKEGPLCS